MYQQHELLLNHLPLGNRHLVAFSLHNTLFI